MSPGSAPYFRGLSFGRPRSCLRRRVQPANDCCCKARVSRQVRRTTAAKYGSFVRLEKCHWRFWVDKCRWPQTHLKASPPPPPKSPPPAPQARRPHQNRRAGCTSTRPVAPPGKDPASAPATRRARCLWDVQPVGGVDQSDFPGCTVGSSRVRSKPFSRRRPNSA